MMGFVFALLLSLASVSLASYPKLLFSDLGGEDAKVNIALGVILTFEQWPSAEQEKIIIDNVGVLGLESFDRIESLKMWIFSWTQGFHTIKEAQDVCRGFSSSFPSDRCEPNVLNAAQTPYFAG